MRKRRVAITFRAYCMACNRAVTVHFWHQCHQTEVGCRCCGCRPGPMCDGIIHRPQMSCRCCKSQMTPPPSPLHSLTAAIINTAACEAVCTLFERQLGLPQMTRLSAPPGIDQTQGPAGQHRLGAVAAPHCRVILLL